MLPRFTSLMLLVALLAAAFAPAPLPAASAPPAAPLAPDPAFQQLWARTDQLVRAHDVARTWFWGDAPFARVYETFAGSPGGQRLVEYYDKSRMEVTNPGLKPTDPWYVTNGLLVKELMSGRIQL